MKAYQLIPRAAAVSTRWRPSAGKESDERSWLRRPTMLTGRTYTSPPCRPLHNECLLRAWCETTLWCDNEAATHAPSAQFAQGVVREAVLACEGRVREGLNSVRQLLSELGARTRRETSELR